MKFKLNNIKMSATFIGNTTAFRVDSRRAFIHWFVNEELKAVEVDEARSNMTDLIQEYEMYETAGVDEVQENEEDDEGA